MIVTGFGSSGEVDLNDADIGTPSYRGHGTPSGT